MSLVHEGYRPRVVDGLVDKHLRAFGAVEIAGTMWSGKTWTSDAHGSSRATLDRRQTRQLAEIDPEVVLSGDSPHVIDEWQRVPEIWDLVRDEVDSSGGKKGLFILTGSSRPAKGQTAHSGSGRISTVKMWPMSLAESGDSRCSVSLAGLFEGEFHPGPTETSLRRLASSICRGGWPGALGLDDVSASLVPGQYLEALVSKRDEEAPGSPRELMAFLRSLSRNIGSAVTQKTLAEDMGADPKDKEELDRESRRARVFLDFFLDRYVISELAGWDAPIKSKARLRTSPKYCFADPSLPAALLGVNEAALMENTQLFGQLFEELCLRDLRVYAQALPGAGADPLRYYRDADGLEVDGVIELRDGRWCAIEIKLGANKAEEACKGLRRLKRKIALNPAARNPEPEFMMVLVGKSDYSYRTEDGICVVPITELSA